WSPIGGQAYYKTVPQRRAAREGGEKKKKKDQSVFHPSQASNLFACLGLTAAIGSWRRWASTRRCVSARPRGGSSTSTIRSIPRKRDAPCRTTSWSIG